MSFVLFLMLAAIIALGFLLFLDWLHEEDDDDSFFG